MNPGNKTSCDKVSYSEVTLIFKERENEGGRKRGKTERNKTWSQKDGRLKKENEKKRHRGEEKGGEKTNPRGTDIHFGKVAPKTLMPVFNTSQNLLSLFKMHVPSKQHQTQDSVQLKKKKYKCNHGAVVLRSAVKAFCCTSASGFMPKQNCL